MRLFSKNRGPVEAPAPAFAFCEPVWATPTSHEHIRTVGEEGLKLGGGVPNPALCGRDLRHGWDLKMEVTTESVTSLASPREGDGRVFLCPGCAEAFLTLPN
jgi:hypothetical protein